MFKLVTLLQTTPTADGVAVESVIEEFSRRSLERSPNFFLG